MTEITVDISEVLRKLDPNKMRGTVADALDGAADIIRADVKKYPPARAESMYRRSGTLGRSWAKRIIRRAKWFEAHIGTHVAYSPFVQDRDRQAWMHKGIWQTAQDVAEGRGDDVVDFIKRALSKWAS